MGEESHLDVGAEERSEMLKDQAPWCDKDFVHPFDLVSCSLLSKKIGLVDSLEKLDVIVREGPQLVFGRDLLKRITMVDLGETLMGKVQLLSPTGATYFLARFGISTYISLFLFDFQLL